MSVAGPIGQVPGHAFRVFNVLQLTWYTLCLLPVLHLKLQIRDMSMSGNRSSTHRRQALQLVWTYFDKISTNGKPPKSYTLYT